MEKPSSSSQRGINLQKNTLSLNARNSLFLSSKIQYRKTKYTKVVLLTLYLLRIFNCRVRDQVRGYAISIAHPIGAEMLQNAIFVVG